MTSTSYDPSTALSLYHTSRATTTTARLWAAEKLLHDFSQIGMFQFFEGPGPDPTVLLNYASNKIWMKTAAGVTTEQATFHVWLGDGLASDEAKWVDLDQTTFQLWLQDSAASEAAAAKASATSAENAAEITTLLAGVAAVYATNAEMAAAASGIAANAIVLVLTDETQGSLAALYKKIAGVMVLQRVVGATGNIVDVRRFGIVGGTDETAKFELLRQYLIAHDGMTVKFQSGVEYQYTTPKWLVGVKNVEVIAYGARFKNLGPGAVGDSSMYASLYLGSGPWTHAQSTGPLIDGGGSPLVATTNGYLVEAASAGAATVTMTTTADAANFEAGQPVFIAHGSRMAASFPPHQADWEYNVVKSVDAGTGIVTLMRPLRHAYRKVQPDFTTYGITWGKARMTPLDRANYQIAERVVWRGGEMVEAGHSWFDGAVLMTGALEVEVYDVRSPTIGPSMCRDILAANCDFYSYSEMDKSIDVMRFDRSHCKNLNQGTGIREIIVEGGSLYGTLCQLRGRKVRLSGVDIKSNPTSGYKTQLGHDQFPCEVMLIEDCTFFPDAASVSGVLSGNATAFVPNAVTATTITVETGNAAYEQMVQNIEAGQRIAIGSGSNGDMFTVQSYAFDASGHLIITGFGVRSSPPSASETRHLYPTTKVEERRNKVQAPPVGWQMVEQYQRHYDGRDDSGDYVFRLRDAAASEYTVLGTVTEIIVDVVKPYTGSDAEVSLDLALSGPGATWAGARVNARTAGQRVMKFGSTAGAQTGDTLAALTSWNIAANLVAYLQKTPAPPYGTYTDGAESSKPVVVVRVKVAKV